MDLRAGCFLEIRRIFGKILTREVCFFRENSEKRHFSNFDGPKYCVVLTELTFFDEI